MEDVKLECRQIFALPRITAGIMLNYGSSNLGLLVTFIVAAAKKIKESSHINSKHGDFDAADRNVAGFFWLPSLG